MSGEEKAMTPEREAYLKDLALSGHAQPAEMRELINILDTRIFQAKQRGIELGLSWGGMGTGCADPAGYRKVFAELINKTDNGNSLGK